MDVSRQVRQDLRCEAGHSFGANVWDVLDHERHPDVELATLVSIPCVHCSAPTPIRNPVLLINNPSGAKYVSVDCWAEPGKAGRTKVSDVLHTPSRPELDFLINIS